MCFKMGLNFSTDFNVSSRDTILARNSHARGSEFKIVNGSTYFCFQFQIKSRCLELIDVLSTWVTIKSFSCAILYI
jgi:hypothetical protein